VLQPTRYTWPNVADSPLFKVRKKISKAALLIAHDHQLGRSFRMNECAKDMYENGTQSRSQEIANK